MSKHRVISIIKSFIRIGGCLIGIIRKSVIITGISLIVAEILGLIEEEYENE